MDKWVLLTEDGFYTGKQYTVQGERYAGVSDDIELAKCYSTHDRAMAATKKFKFINYLEFDVVRYSQYSKGNQ